MHSASPHSFYGGTNEVVLYCVDAKQKIAFIHCDSLKKYGRNTKYIKKLYSKFDKVAACSEGSVKQFIITVPSLSKKTFCVSNCQNYQEIISLANDNPIVYNKNILNIITVSRLSSEKGLERALTAIYRCINAGHKLHYHIVGDGDQRIKLEKMVCEIGIRENVTFYGNQANPYRYIKNADLFVLPSYHEAAPMVFEESKCLGVPILATKTSSTTEMIINSNAGWVCENEEEEFYKNLLCIVEYPEKLRFFTNAHKTYNNNKAVQEFINLLLK